MKKYLLFVMLLCFFGTISAQNYTRTVNGITSSVSGMNVNISFYTDDIVRVVKFPSGISWEHPNLTVLLKPNNVNFKVIDKGPKAVELSSSKITVDYDTKTGRVTFFSNKGNILLTEKDYGTQFTPRKDGKEKSFWVRQAFMLDPDEPIYGLGQQQTGLMSQRGQHLELMQRNKRICIPFFQSVKGYGIYWDNYSPTVFEDNKQETSFYSEAGLCSDYYFLYGGTMDRTIAKVRELTGDVPLMPIWASGFFQCRAAYNSTAELLDVVHRYRKEHIPFDVIIQDWHYWGDNQNWNSMSFDIPEYKDAQAMIDDVHKNHAKFMITEWPSFGRATKQYKEFDKNNMLLRGIVTWPNDGAAIYDAFNPKARDIYWKYLKHFYDMGTDAWWMDATEPEQYEERASDFDVATCLGTFRSVRNAYPLMTNMGVYQHLRAAGP